MNCVEEDGNEPWNTEERCGELRTAGTQVRAPGEHQAPEDKP